MIFKAQLLDEDAVKRSITRISHEIIEKNNGVEDLVLVGVKSRGIPIAHQIKGVIFSATGKEVGVGELDISLYRDDLTEYGDVPVVAPKELGVAVNGKNVVLVDDVLYTGRTVRAAIDAIFREGRPACIRLAVLIDRGHRELPFKPDFVGKNVPTSKNELILVSLPPYDEQTQVEIYEVG